MTLGLSSRAMAKPRACEQRFLSVDPDETQTDFLVAMRREAG